MKITELDNVKGVEFFAIFLGENYEIWYDICLAPNRLEQPMHRIDEICAVLVQSIFNCNAEAQIHIYTPNVTAAVR